MHLHYLLYVTRHPLQAAAALLLCSSSLAWLLLSIAEERRVSMPVALYCVVACLGVCKLAIVPIVREGLNLTMEERARAQRARDEHMRHARAEYARYVAEKKSK